MTGYYEYLTLHSPSDMQLNSYAKQGWRVVSVWLQVTNSGLFTVLMERVVKEERD